MDKCGFNDADTNLELQDRLAELCDQIWDEESESDQRALFVSGLKEIGQGYDTSSAKDLSKYIQDYVEDNYPDLSEVVPANAEVYIAGIDSNIDSDALESEGKTQALESPNTYSSRDIPTKGFISKAYGTATDVQMKMERDLKHNIVKSFILDREGSKIIDTSSELNSSLRKYQQDLLNIVKDFLIDKYSKMQSDKYNKEEALLELQSLNMYDNGDYNGAIERMNRVLSPFITAGKITSEVLNGYYGQMLMGHKPSRMFIDAYNAYVVLNNFDALLKSRLGKSLSITPNLYGKFSAEDKYSLSGEHANNITSWRTSDDIHPEEEIDDITNLIISTTPVYLWQSTTPVFNRDLGVQEFGYIMSEVKDLVYNPDAKAIKFNAMTLLKYPSLNKYRNDLNGRSFYDILSLTRSNPQKWFPIVFEIINTPSFFNTYSSSLFRSFHKPQMDLIYTVYKGMFSNSPDSLLGVRRNNINRVNYYGYITQLADSLAIMKYSQYYQNEEGNVVLRTLKDSSTNTIRLKVENKINGMLSRVAPIRFDELLSKYEAAYDASTKTFSFSIPNSGIKASFRPNLDRNLAFTFTRVIPEKDGNTTVTLAAFNGEKDWNNLISFFNDFAKVDFESGSPYMSNYLSLKTEGGEVQYNNATRDLAQLSGSIFFNSYFSHKLANRSESLFDLQDDISNVYEEQSKSISISKSAGEIGLISNPYIPILSDLAIANGMTTGIFASSVVKDAEGNSLAANTITRLFDSFHTQWVEQCMSNPFSASKDFSLLSAPGLLTGMVVSREAKMRDESKTHSSFNVAESYFSSLIYDYIGGIVADGDGKVQHDAGFMPSVNSDKTIILKEMINLSAISKFNKPYNKLTQDEIKNIISLEFGKFYSTVVSNIREDYDKLNEFNKANGIGVLLNPLTNFSEFNTAYGNSAESELLAMVREYNSVNQNKIELAEEVHYTRNKGKIGFNRTIVSLTNRFAPAYFSSIDLTKVFGPLTTSTDFWATKEREILSTLLDENFRVDTTTDLGNPITNPEIDYLAKQIGWINPNTKRVTLAKYTPKTGNSVNISKWSDFGDISYVDDAGVTHTYLSDDFELSKLPGTITLHPTIAQHNLLDYFFTQEFMLTTVGNHYAHPAKGAVNDSLDLVEEAARYNAQHKRNVAFTASMKVFQQNTLEGMPSVANMVTIADIASPVYNIMGDFEKKGAKPFDGATFVNPFIAYLENYSLGGSAAGLDKKQFGHAYKERTGNGIVVKTAGFALTNNRILNSMFNRRMMFKMTKPEWKDNMGNLYMGDITKNYLGEPIQYEDMYFRVGDIKYVITNIATTGNNMYTRSVALVNENGTIVGPSTEQAPTLVQSNFDLWSLFGGMYSMELKNNELIPSEASVRNVVIAMNSVGIPMSEVIETQSDLYQPLKHSDTHYVATAGAVKQGASNVASDVAYYDDIDYNGYTMSTRNFGIQLDANHHADEANLSIMTQVISSLSSRGYTVNKAQEVYDALGNMTKAAVKSHWDSYSEFIQTDNPEKFQDVVTKGIIKAIMNTDGTDGGIVQAVAQDLLEIVKNGGEVTFKDSQGVIPYSDPSVFNQLVSTITSTLNRASIRTKFPGLLAVLNPSHTIYKLYGDRKLESFNSREEIKALQAEYDANPLSSVSDIELGRQYKITVDGGTTTVNVETPLQYYDLKDALAGRDYSIVEYIVDGRDLASYRISFRSLDGTSYNMWDLDAVKNLFKHKNSSEILVGPSKGELLQYLQGTLKALSSGNLDTVSIDGNMVVIDKETINIKPYEAIIPRIQASKFGLNIYNDLKTIQDDPYFFLKKMINNWASKVDDKDFQYELKKLNGSHVYLINKQYFNSASLSKKEIEKRIEDGKVFRVGEDGSDIHRLASDNDEIYTDVNGNEVIVSDNLGFYLDTVDYHTIRMSNKILDNNKLEEILKPLYNSSNRTAQKLSKQLMDNPIKGISLSNTLYNKSLDSILDNPEGLIEDPAISNIYEAARSIHTSFLKSLDLLAARIPSQTMQSFMPMKIVAYENSDINSAYVNYWQIWLQGSDFDIDKVSLLSYAFDKNGKYIGWSPYFNLNSINTLKSSENLPFPTGVELRVEPTNDPALLSLYNEIESSGLIKANGEEIIFGLNYDEYNENGTLEFFGDILRGVKSGVLYVPSIDNNTDAIKKVIDRHNLYTTKGNPERGVEMLKNFISTHMYNISIDPINLIQSQSPIDLGDPQTAAKSSSSGKAVKTFTPGNNVNKHRSLFENMVGKEVIGISAAGMKDFFALTQYYNITLKSGNSDKQSYLWFDKNIGGQQVNLLANSYVDNLSSVTNPAVYDAVIKVDNTRDAALVLSALLSCATDNAKELVLAKINAGPDMVGLYIYGTSIGIEFSSIAKVMMSNTARVISKIKNGNIFNGDKGHNFTNSIFKYIDLGPSLDGLGPIFLGKIAATLEVPYNSTDLNAAKFFLRDAMAKNLHALDYKATADGKDSEINFRLPTKLKMIKDLQSEASKLQDQMARIQAYKFIDTLSEYINNLNTVYTDKVTRADGSTFTPYNVIKDLSFGGSELRRLGSVLGLNQGLKTDVAGKLGFIRKFENLIADRYSELDKNDMNSNVRLFGETVQLGSALDMFQAYTKEENYKLSFEKFVTDKVYRDNVIEYYNAIKHTFNILDVVWSLPHFRGYLETAFLDYKEQGIISSKFRAIDRIGNTVVQTYDLKSSRDIENVYKGVQGFLDNSLINSWLKSSDKMIEITPGSEYFTKQGLRLQADTKVPILLGTPNGKASFKLWMESRVIPDLKQGILNEKTKVFLDNSFIKDLSPVRIDKTVTRNSSFIYTLPVSTLPKSDSERAAYLKYKSDFNRTLSLRYYGYPVTDLFFYYNLINFRNSTTQNSLTPLFEDMLRDGSAPLLKEYNTYVSNFDTKSDLVEGVDYILEDAIHWCAPASNTWAAKTMYTRAYDYNTMTTKLYKRLEKGESKSSYNNDDDYDVYGNTYDYEDNMDTDDRGDIGDEAGQGSYVDRGQIGKVNPKYEELSDGLDRTYFLTVESLINTNTSVRLSASTTINISSGSLVTAKYKGKTYNKAELVALVEAQGGQASDLDLIYEVKRVDNENITILSKDILNNIIEHTLNNPCE